MIFNLDPDDIDNILTIYNDFALNVQMSQELRRNLVIEFKKTLDKICSQYTFKNKKYKIIKRAKKMIKVFKVEMSLIEEEYEELLERLECDEYNYVGDTDQEQEEYEKKMRKMRDEMIHQIKKNLIII